MMSIKPWWEVGGDRNTAQKFGVARAIFDDPLINRAWKDAPKLYISSQSQLCIKGCTERNSVNAKVGHISGLIYQNKFLL
jgi:hypothetical protein